MRQFPLALGSVLLFIAVGVTLDSWSTIVDPSSRRRAFDELRVGMTNEQVNELLGEKGHLRSWNGPGSVSPGQGPPPPAVYELRWEDAYTTVDVEFRRAEVTRITRTPKEPPELDVVNRVRVRLLVIAATGLLFIIGGLCSRPSDTAPATPPPA